MVKHPLQNLGFKERRENTHTRLRLVQKQQFINTHTQRTESVQLASTWISLVFSGRSGQPAKDHSHLMSYKEKLTAGQTLTPAPFHFLIGKTLTMAHPDWPDCKVTA